MSQILQNFVKFQKFQLENLVDFEKCCKTHIFLQNFALIQPRTSPPKICKICTNSGRSRTETNQDLLALELDSQRRRSLANLKRKEAKALRLQKEKEMKMSATRRPIGKISAKCCSFSAVSAPIFARKYAFCSIFQNLPDSQAEIFEI